MGNKHIIVVHMIMLWAFAMYDGVKKRIRIESCLLMVKNKAEKCIKSAEVVVQHQAKLLAYLLSNDVILPFDRAIVISDNAMGFRFLR